MDISVLSSFFYCDMTAEWIKWRKKKVTNQRIHPHPGVLSCVLIMLEPAFPRIAFLKYFHIMEPEDNYEKI